MSSLPPDTLPPTEAPVAPPRQGSLGTVAMTLGITGMVVGLVPFYGSTFALPLCIAAIVLGIIARPRPDESHRHATVGLTTGIIGLAVTAAWVGVFFGGFGLFGGSSGYESSSTLAVEAGGAHDMGTGLAPAPVGGGDSVTVDEAEGTFRTDLSGEATLQLGERTLDLALTSCAVMSLEWDGTVLRGSGPDGTLALTQTTSAVIMDLALGSDVDGTYVGRVSGMSSSSSSGRGDDHEVLVVGTLRRAADGSAVSVDLVATCAG